MIDINNLKEAQLAAMAEQIENLVEQKSEKDLYMALGNALYDSGLDVNDEGETELVSSKFFKAGNQKVNLNESFDFVSDPTPQDKEKSKESGKKFWDRFKEELRDFICNDEKIKALFQGDGKLKDYLMASIPIIISALGWAAMGPLGLAILASVAALIGKVGFAAYCNI